MLRAVGNHVLNQRTDEDLGACLFGAADLIIDQPLDDIKDLLPCLAIGTAHAHDPNIGKQVGRLLAKAPFEAGITGAWAGGLAKDAKKFGQAIDLFDMVIECKKLSWEYYSMALWSVLRSNVKRKVPEQELAEYARRFAKRCLRHAGKHGGVRHNLALVYAELGDLAAAKTQFQAARDDGYPKLEQLRRELYAVDKNPAFAK